VSAAGAACAACGDTGVEMYKDLDLHPCVWCQRGREVCGVHAPGGPRNGCCELAAGHPGFHRGTRPTRSLWFEGSEAEYEAALKTLPEKC